MGTEFLWIPAVMSVVAAGSQYVNQRNQQRRADRIALQSLQSNSQRQRRADQVTQQLIADTAASTPEGERQSTLAGFMEQLSRAQPEAQSGLRPASGASEAYRKDAADAALGVSQQGANYAQLAARLDAPGLQREREGRRRGNAGIDLGLLGREQQGEDRTTDTRLRGIRSNPWLDALSAVAGGVASGYGSGGMGTAKSAGSFTPAANSMLDPALGSAWGGQNSLIWGNYGGLR